MKFKESTELKTLADMAGLSVVEFSDTVISQLIKSGAIEDTPDCWGLTLHKALDETTHVKILVNILNNVGIEQVTERDFAAFIDLVFMGDNDCPKCGGEMEVIDGKYKRTFGDGYMTPYEFKPEWEDKKYNKLLTSNIWKKNYKEINPYNYLVLISFFSSIKPSSININLIFFISFVIG